MEEGKQNAQAPASEKAKETSASPRPVLAAEPAEWERAVIAAGGKAFQARSVLRWIFDKDAADFAAITDLPKAVREKLQKEYCVLESRVAEERRAPDGTVKLLLALRDGETIEVVRMPGASGATVCVSTQVGCPMA